MGLLDNLKDQAMKRASQLVDKAQEKLGEMKPKEDEEEMLQTPSSTEAETSMRERTTSTRKERLEYEQRTEGTSYHPQPENRMFSKELEALIQAALEDGVLEEYEKAALARRAQAEGVDLAELEIYINSILQRRKKEQARREDERQTIIDQKKKEAFGRVCPNCGKQVPPLTLKCDCGYEFTSQNKVSSVQILMEKIETITGEEINVGGSEFFLKQFTGKSKEDIRDKRRTDKIYNLISVFPVPNTKEDIIEFLSLAASNSKTKGGLWGSISGRILILIIVAAIVLGGGAIIISSFSEPYLYSFLSFPLVILMAVALNIHNIDQGTLRHNKIAKAWRTKFDQVMLKARSLRGDPEFTQQLDYYENLLNKK